jgi:hypothetical protein
MARSDRSVVAAERAGGVGAVRLFALVSVVSIVALSGLLAPVASVDVSFPVLGEADAPADGGAEEPPPDVVVNTSAALSVSGPDRDQDGLADAVEAELGTDPTRADTDGDGYPDGMELGCEDRLPDADPLVQDVYVEVDSVANVSLSNGSVDRLQESFASSPVENQGRDSGMAVHVIRSDGDLAESGPVTNRDAASGHACIADYRSEHFDRRGLGYHYLLIVSDAAYQGDPSYAGAAHRGNVVVEHYDRDYVMASLIMHELGHSFGLMHREDGVDEERYSLAEYHSVMNYNGIYETMTYSDGSDAVGRDEWAFVAQDRHRPPLDCPGGDCLAACSAGE